MSASLSIFGGELSKLGIKITTNEELPFSMDAYHGSYFSIEVLQEG